MDTSIPAYASLGADINKRKIESTPETKQGVVSDKLPELSLEMDDQYIVKLSDKWEKAWNDSNAKQEWINSGIVAIAKKHGFKWGGDFKNYHDPVHFYNDFGIPAVQMKEMLIAGKVDKKGYLKV